MLGYHCLNDMVYIYYNLQFSMKQIEKTLDVDTICLDNNDTMFDCLVEVKSSIMEESPEWLDEDEQGQGGMP
jgi:hypothetical protein